MNNWQKKFQFLRKHGFKTNDMTYSYAMLETIKEYVITNGMVFKVSEDVCDTANGIISVRALAYNLPIWKRLGYKITTK